MHRKYLLTVLVVILTLLGTLGAGVASAASLNPPFAQTIELSCAPNDYGIDNITAIVMENSGSWSPGHIVAIDGVPKNMTGIPLAFHVILTDSSGAVVATFDEVKPGHRNGITNPLQCSFVESFTDEQGNDFTVTNTVTVFIAPRG
jgi:hypothetical protein